MNTSVYLIRHADSPYADGAERTRGLSEKGQVDAEKVMSVLEKEHIDLFISSPYVRAIQTIQAAAGTDNIVTFERFGFEFWESTSMPDIYRVEFEQERLVSVTRMWEPV